MLISSTHLCSISSVHDRQIRLLGVSPEVIALVSLMSESRQPKAAVHCHGPYKHAADLRSHRTAPVGQQRHAVRHARGAVRSTIVRSGGSRSHWKRSLWSPKWPSPASPQPPFTNTVRISTVPTSRQSVLCTHPTRKRMIMIIDDYQPPERPDTLACGTAPPGADI